MSGMMQEQQCVKYARPTQPSARCVDKYMMEVIYHTPAHTSSAAQADVQSCTHLVIVLAVLVIVLAVLVVVLAVLVIAVLHTQHINTNSVSHPSHTGQLWSLQQDSVHEWQDADNLS
jgi:hypothetical protein